MRSCALRTACRALPSKTGRQRRHISQPCEHKPQLRASNFTMSALFDSGLRPQLARHTRYASSSHIYSVDPFDQTGLAAIIADVVSLASQLEYCLKEFYKSRPSTDPVLETSCILRSIMHGLNEVSMIVIVPASEAQIASQAQSPTMTPSCKTVRSPGV